MEIELRSFESNLLYLICRGVISQHHIGETEDPMRMIGAWKGNVLLNLQQCNYIDSSGVAWLLHWHRRVEQAGGVFALCTIPPQLDQVFQVCQLHRILSIWQDEKTARIGLTSSQPQSSKHTSLGPARGNAAEAN